MHLTAKQLCAQLGALATSTVSGAVDAENSVVVAGKPANSVPASTTLPERKSAVTRSQEHQNLPKWSFTEEERVVRAWTRQWQMLSRPIGKKLSSAGPSLIAGSNHSGSMPPLQTPQLQESSPSSDVSCRTQRPTTQQIEAVISAAVSAARKAAASTVFAAIQVAQVTRVRLSAEPVTKAPSGKKAGTRKAASAQHLCSEEQMHQSARSHTRSPTPGAGSRPTALPYLSPIPPQCTLSEPVPTLKPSGATATQKSGGSRCQQAGKLSKPAFEASAPLVIQGRSSTMPVRTAANVSSGTAAAAHGATPLAGAPHRTSRLPVTAASAPGQAANPVNSWGIPLPQCIQPQWPAAPTLTDPSRADMHAAPSGTTGRMIKRVPSRKRMRSGERAHAAAGRAVQLSAQPLMHGTLGVILPPLHPQSRPGLAFVLPSSAAPAVNAVPQRSAPFPGFPYPQPHPMSAANVNSVPRAEQTVLKSASAAPQADHREQEGEWESQTPMKRIRANA